MYCFVVVVFSFNSSSCSQRVVTMALKSLYRVCEIKKLDLIFSSFRVRSQNHKNSIVFRLARHLCSSTPLVFVLITIAVCMSIIMIVVCIVCYLLITGRIHYINNQIEHGVDECEDIDDVVKNVNEEKLQLSDNKANDIELHDNQAYSLVDMT